jgi:lambda family phage portal protein
LWFDEWRISTMKIFSFFKKKESDQTDKSRIDEKLAMYEKAFQSFFNSSPILDIFAGDKIKGSLNYPTALQFDTQTLRLRSRKAILETPQAAAALKRLEENVINSGLTLEMTPIWDLLNLNWTEEQQNAWTRKVEQLWKIYSDNKECSYDRKKTFQQLQSIKYHNYLRDGEVFIILRYSIDKNRLNPLSLQIIDAENIQTPCDNIVIKNAEDAGNKIIDGIEFAPTGEEIAYYVLDTVTLKVNRIEKIGQKSKRAFVIHTMITEYVDQTRGIPFLSGVLHELQKVTDYSLLELQAAVINAILAFWVKPSDINNSSQPFSGVKVKGNTSNTDVTVEKSPDFASFKRGGVIVQNLKQGEEVSSFDTKRPNINFDAFVTAIIKHLSSSLSIPLEVLTMTFGQNYSASRATLILFWNKIIQERSNFEVDILDPIFEMWMLGEIEAGRITAPGFDNKLLRCAWLNNRWIGISQPSIDPLKEANAVDIRLAQGTTTHEIESQKFNGTSYVENVNKLKQENKLLSEANASLIPKTTTPVNTNLPAGE